VPPHGDEVRSDVDDDLPAAPLPDAHAAPACASSRRISSRGPHLWHSHVMVPSSSSMPNAVPTVTHRPQVGHDRLSVVGRRLVRSPLAASRRISRTMSLMRSPPLGDHVGYGAFLPPSP
jgi:hypothetical protein